MVWGLLRGSAVRTIALGSVLLLLTAVMLLSAQPSVLDRSTRAAFATVQARAATDLLDSIGVNAHMGYPATPYATNPSLVAQRLRELGIRHIRENIFRLR